MAIFTEKTIFLELNQKVNCTSEFAKRINIDDETIKKARYQNWYLLNNKFYYAKILNDKEILNYLLCEKIAKGVFNLQTPHFLLSKINNKTGLASLNFRKPNINYFYANQDYFPFDNPCVNFEYLKQFFISLDLDSYFKLIDDLLKLISFHIYTGLRDLINCNLLFQEEENGFSLSYLYDFDFAFEQGIIENYHYKSSICHFELPSNALNNLLEKYPNFRNYLLYFLTIDIRKILGKIEKEYHLNIELYLEYYLKQDKIKKDFVRSLHL